jgi:hypothetical protein
MRPKVAAVVMIKNECDIIEHFVRINSRAVDHIYIIDHNSNDSTLEILSRLVLEGLPLSVLRETQLDFKQADILTKQIKIIAASNAYDFIVPLDADEFIHCGDNNFGMLLASEIDKPGHCGHMRWVTYAPVPNTPSPIDSSIYDLFRMRSNEPTQYYKTIIPNEIAKICRLQEGSHFCILNNMRIVSIEVSAILQHVPIRSAAQITSKTLLGRHRLSIKPGRLLDETLHWDRIANFIKEKNYALSTKDVSWLACRYTLSLEQEIPATPSLDETAPRVGNPEDRISFLELAAISPISNLDTLCGELCKEVNKLRQLARENIPPKVQTRSNSILLRLIASFGK